MWKIQCLHTALLDQSKDDISVGGEICMYMHPRLYYSTEIPFNGIYKKQSATVWDTFSCENKLPDMFKFI